MDTLFTGRTLIELDTVPSTNTYAMQALKAGNLTEGTLIVALHQTEGRGQYGNSWHSEAGQNLTFSLVMRPDFLRADKQFYLSKAASLAVFGMLTEVLPASQYDMRIKWPNDLLVNGEKIAGILIENQLSVRGYLQYSVVGVGLNVNQQMFGETKRKATSLAILLGKRMERDILLERFCKHFEALYLSLKRGKTEAMDRQYLNNLYRFNKVTTFRAGGQEFEAVISNVSEDGRLQLKTESGYTRQFSFKEVEFLQ